MERYCIACGEEIEECMGFVLARDFIDFINGKRSDMREICGSDAIRLHAYVLNGGDKRVYIENLLENQVRKPH